MSEAAAAAARKFIVRVINAGESGSARLLSEVLVQHGILHSGIREHVSADKTDSNRVFVIVSVLVGDSETASKIRIHAREAFPAATISTSIAVPAPASASAPASILPALPSL